VDFSPVKGELVSFHLENENGSPIAQPMSKLTVTEVSSKGGIVHFDDGSRALVNSKHHHISSAWSPGTKVLMVRQNGEIPGTFHLHESEEEFVDCAWYTGNRQIL
jgi:hypothetical protein